MDCKVFRGLIQDYYDGELDAFRRSEYERHRSSCKNCCLLDHRYRIVHELLGELPIFEPSAQFDLEVLERLYYGGCIGKKHRRVLPSLERTWRAIPAFARGISIAVGAAAVFLAVYRPVLWILAKRIAVGFIRTREALVLLRDSGGRLLGYIEAWDVIRSLQVTGETFLRVFRGLALTEHSLQIGLFLMVLVIAYALLAVTLGVFRRKGEDNVYAI